MLKHFKVRTWVKKDKVVLYKQSLDMIEVMGKKDKEVLYMKGMMRLERRREAMKKKILLKQFKVQTWVKKDEVVLYKQSLDMVVVMGWRGERG